MGKFLNGLFIGVGVGLLIAPQTGEETRRMIMERAVALRKSMLPEDEQHFSIDTHPPQVPPLPAQPAAAFFSEPEMQETASVPPAQPDETLSSEPQVQGITSVPVARPATAFFSEPEMQETASVPPAQPDETLSSEPQVQGITSVPVADTTSTPSNQNANLAGNSSNIADTAQTAGSTENPDQLTPTETPRADTAITEKLPPLSSPSNTPSRTARRKTSPRTPNVSKSRGHSRS